MSSMTHRAFALLIPVLTLIGGVACPAQELVTLTMTERAGVNRQGEWITIGVPLPQGKVRSTDELCVLQDGRAIPAEILPVNKWWDDGSLRWVHLVFRSDCRANDKASVTLALGAQAPAPQYAVVVTEETDHFLVDTSAVALKVRKKGFNVIDAAKIRNEQVIKTHERGLCVRVDGQEYCSALDPNGTVILEEKGPLHAVLRATGSLLNSGHERKFDYDCRLYAYAGSPEVRIVVSLINRQGNDADFIPLDAFLMELPTTITAGKCLFGAEDGRTKTGSLSDAPEAYIYQVSSGEHIFGGAVRGKGGGKQTKPDNIGWAHLSDAGKGMGVGVRWFWQLYPKSIELTAEGVVRVGLYPARHNKPLKIYTGVARTHEVRLRFTAGGVNTDQLKGTFAGLQRPLRPFAPPKWYCRDTQALGDYCEAGGAELYGPFADEAAAFDEAFESANRRSQAFRDSRTIKGVETDSYGFLGFGDGVHHVWTPGVDVPENIAWDGNYYGYPHMMCIQFLRTGNPEYFDNFEAHALHVADVHIVHYSEKAHLAGGCRYCPPTDHVRIDPTDWNDYRTAKVYVSNLFNHHKIAGVIERWYFLRDHRSLDVANMVLDYCYRWTYGDNDYGQPRGPGMIMNFCYQGYMLTGDKRWIRRASNVLRAHKDRELKLSFQAGIFLEGMRRYYEISADQEALEYIKASTDRLIEQGRKGGVTAQAHSFMYLKTAERKYLSAALDNLPRSSQFENPWKQFALSMRNAAMCIGDLHRAAQMHLPTNAQEKKTEIRVKDSSELNLAIRALKPGTTLRLEPGIYSGGIYLRDITGTGEERIVIEGADTDNPPVFTGGSQALHFADCSHLTLRNIKVKGFPANGINIDDGGSYETPAHHIILENLIILETGPKGNHDALKMSGVDHFAVRKCRFEGWGGSGIDMVGCHHGVIEDCTFTGREGFSQSNAVQLKGGTQDVLVQCCFFNSAGQRSVNLGGSTGLRFFRPKVQDFEAKNITVAGNRFVGSMAPVAWVTSDGGYVHHNTIVMPAKWVLRILQESAGARFTPCHDGIFERNLVLFDSTVQTFVNVGPGTSPETFQFQHNAWLDLEGHREPSLPVPETEGIYIAGTSIDRTTLTDAELELDDNRLRGVGAHAYMRVR